MAIWSSGFSRNGKTEGLAHITPWFYDKENSKLIYSIYINKQKNSSPPNSIFWFYRGIDKITHSDNQPNYPESKGRIGKNYGFYCVFITQCRSQSGGNAEHRVIF